MTEVIVGIDHRHARLTQANFQRSRPSRRHQRGTGKLGSVRKTARVEKIDDYEDAIAHDGWESSIPESARNGYRQVAISI